MSLPKILQVGLGGFGRNHLKAWHQMGMGDYLYLADLNPTLHAETKNFNFPKERIATDINDFIDLVDVVDIVTPSHNHFELCEMAISKGKDVFVEKPMTMTSDEAIQLTKILQESGKILQVGYYYRFHPGATRLRSLIKNGNLGEIRYLSGNFMGFKRARTDVGVTHTDGIHFIDLFNWLLSSIPDKIFAITRDHFSRGLEDFSVVMLQYPNGTVAKIESGYIQPGKWRDKVVPDAFTSKEIFVCGSQATVELDFEIDQMKVHGVHQEFIDNTWKPIFGDSEVPLNKTADPVQMISSELNHFLACVKDRKRTSADSLSSGVVLAKIIEAIYASALEGKTIEMNWTDEEKESLYQTPVTD